jgi:hypothetical protein
MALCRMWWADRFSVETQNERTLFLCACPHPGRAFAFCLETDSKQTCLPHERPSKAGSEFKHRLRVVAAAEQGLPKITKK